jgi:hypothetical protein
VSTVVNDLSKADLEGFNKDAVQRIFGERFRTAMLSCFRSFKLLTKT